MTAEMRASDPSTAELGADMSDDDEDVVVETEAEAG